MHSTVIQICQHIKWESVFLSHRILCNLQWLIITTTSRGYSLWMWTEVIF